MVPPCVLYIGGAWGWWWVPQRERQRAVRSAGNSARSPSQVRKLQATWRAAVLPSVHFVLF
eukprot:1733197-Prymnesium_polylepis.1